MSSRHSPKSQPPQPPPRRRSVIWSDDVSGGLLSQTKIVSPLPEAYFRSPVRDETESSFSPSPSLPNLASLSSTFNPNRVSSSSSSSSSTFSYSQHNPYKNDTSFDTDLLTSISRDERDLSNTIQSRPMTTSSSSALDRAAQWLSVTQRKQRGPIKAFATTSGTSVLAPSRQFRADEAALIEPKEVPILQQSQSATTSSQITRISASPTPFYPALKNSPRVEPPRVEPPRVLQQPSPRNIADRSRMNKPVVASSPASTRLDSFTTPISATVHKTTTFSSSSSSFSSTSSGNSLLRGIRAQSPLPSTAMINTVRGAQAPSPLPTSLLTRIPPSTNSTSRAKSSPMPSFRNSSPQTAQVKVSQHNFTSSHVPSTQPVPVSLRRGSLNSSLDTLNLKTNRSTTSVPTTTSTTSLLATIKGPITIQRPPSPASQFVKSTRLNNNPSLLPTGGPIRATVPLPSETFRLGTVVPPPALNSNATPVTSYLLTHQNRSLVSANKSSPRSSSPAINRPSNQTLSSPARQLESRLVSNVRDSGVKSTRRGVSLQSPTLVTRTSIATNEAAFSQSIKSHVERVAGWKQSKTKVSIAPSPVPPPIPNSARVTIERGKEVNAPRSPKSQQKVPRARGSDATVKLVVSESTPASIQAPVQASTPTPVTDTIKNESNVKVTSPSQPLDLQKQVQETSSRPTFQVRPLGTPLSGKQSLIQTPTPLRVQTSFASSFSSPFVHRIADSPRSSILSVSAAAPPPPPPLPSSHRKVSLNSPASSLFTKTSKIPLSSARFLSPLTTSLRNAPIRLASGLKENKESRVSPIKADKPNRRG
jgi:hypothetical protein